MLNYTRAFFILFLCFSCERYSPPAFPENPLWLETRIKTIEAGTNFGYKINVYTWKEGYYYHIENMISSCMFCELYNYEGVEIRLSESEMNDFLANGKLIGTVWSSPPYTESHSRKISIEKHENRLVDMDSSEE